MMKQSESRLRVVRLFENWAAATGKGIPYTAADGGFIFYTWLSAKHPEALDFRAIGDKWQTVHVWLRQAKLVTR